MGERESLQNGATITQSATSSIVNSSTDERNSVLGPSIVTNYSNTSTNVVNTTITSSVAAAAAAAAAVVATGSRPSSKSLGPRVGFYEIERTIGKGNFAVVKLARHRITRTEVSFVLLYYRIT